MDPPWGRTAPCGINRPRVAYQKALPISMLPACLQRAKIQNRGERPCPRPEEHPMDTGMIMTP